MLAIPSAADLFARQGPIVPGSQAPPPNTVSRDIEYAVTMQGCIFGKRFKADSDDRMTQRALALVEATEFSLEGPKELLQQIQREHDGHFDEVAGVVVVPGERQRDGDVTIRDIGSRTRIFAGANQSSREDGPAAGAGSYILRLKVKSVEHIDEKCHLR